PFRKRRTLPVASAGYPAGRHPAQSAPTQRSPAKRRYAAPRRLDQPADTPTGGQPLPATDAQQPLVTAVVHAMNAGAAPAVPAPAHRPAVRSAPTAGRPRPAPPTAPAAGVAYQDWPPAVPPRHCARAAG